MIPTTFNGEPVYLLHFRAEWSNGFELRPHMQTQIDRSKGGISARQPQGETLRSRLLFDLQLYQAEQAQFRVGLQRLKNERILCPFWAAAHNAYTGVAVYLAPGGEVYTTDDGSLYTSGSGETPWVSSSLWLTFEQNWSHWEVHITALPTGFTPSTTAVRVPLLLGYFEQPPDPPAITDRLITCQIQFVESSPAAFALRPVIVPPVYGPSLNGRAVPLFPLAPDWSTQPQAGQATVQVDRQQLGRSRELAETFFPQDAVRVLALSYSPNTWTESAALLSFFCARLGQAETFWLPGPLSECRLISVTSASSPVIHVDDASLLGDNRYIALTRPDITPVMRHVIAVDLVANTLTLDSPPGVFGAEQVNLVSLILVRFAKPEIGIRFCGGSADACRLDFIEEPAEYYNPAGETLGTTMGALPKEAYCYAFTRRYPDTTVVDRYTSYERDLTVAGNLYTAKPIDHGELVDSLDPDETVAKLTARNFPGNPLALLYGQSLEVPLEVQILRCLPQPDGTASAVESMFWGNVTHPARPKDPGSFFTADGVNKLAILQEKVPVPVLQPDCWKELFTAPCGLARSDWTFTAQVVSISATTLVLGSFVRTSGAAIPTFGQGWFAYGKLSYGAGTAYAARTIYDSSPISSGQVTFSVSQAFLTPPAIGSTVTLEPGCPGTIPWCQHYANYPQNYGGFPMLPIANPSFVTNRYTPEVSGKK